MKATELKDLSTSELDKQLREASEQLVNLRMRKQTGQVERPHELRALRRDIARIKTVLNLKRKEEAVASA